LDNPTELDIQLGYDQHSRLSEYDRLVYPVVSRRSRGLSLGINLNPDKRCNFDCVYCQVERDEPEQRIRIDLQQIEQELRGWLESLIKGEGQYRGYELVDIAIAGDGEPTLEKQLPGVIALLMDLKREYELAKGVKLVLFTNGSGLDRQDLIPLWPAFFQQQGEVWFKLDYWEADSLERINRSKVRFETLMEKLTTFSRQFPVVLQSCFFQWREEAFSDGLYQSYIDLVQSLLEQGGQVLKIQAYTLARKPAEAQALPWSDSQMNRLAALLRSHLNLPIELFYETGVEEAG
jgi:wyosine [tRNA(Phe)-imidazoG37] synthetase (radical SAM superfamily)